MGDMRSKFISILSSPEFSGFDLSLVEKDPKNQTKTKGKKIVNGSVKIVPKKNLWKDCRGLSQKMTTVEERTAFAKLEALKEIR